MLAPALGLHGVGSVLEAERMTPEELNVREHGYPMQRPECGREIRLQTYLNRLTETTDKSGKNYLYGNFNDFHNETKARNTILGDGCDEPVSNDLIAIAKC